MSSTEIVAFSDDAEHLVIAQRDGQVKVWNAFKKRLAQTFTPVIVGKSSIQCLAWSSERGKGRKEHDFLALGTGNSVVIWNATKGEQEAILESDKGGRVNGICWNPFNDVLYCALSDHHVVVWDTETWKQSGKWKADRGEISCVCCNPNGSTLVTAGRKIKLWNTQDHSLLQSFIGHATLVRCLVFINESLFVSCAENDRVVDVWKQGGGAQSWMSFVCEESVLAVDARQEENLIQLITIATDGSLHLFSSSLEEENEEPIHSTSVVQFVSSASETSTPSSLPVLAARLISSQVHVAHSSLIRPTFESIDFTQTEPRVCLVRELKKGLLIHENGPSILTDSHPPEKVQILTSGTVTQTVTAKKMEDDVPLMDQLTTTVGVEKAGRKRHKANAESLSKMLAQAIHTEDKALMMGVLKITNSRIVNGTIRKLPSILVVPLVKQLVNLLYAKPERGLELSVWLRAIFISHTAYLTTIPHIVESLSGLYQLLDTRVGTFGKLCHLQGKLDLMISQSTLDRTSEGVSSFDKPLLSITAGENAAPVSSDFFDQEEEDWSSGLSSEEDGNDVNADEDDNEGDEENDRGQNSSDKLQEGESMDVGLDVEELAT